MGRPRANKCEGCRRRHLKCDLLRPLCTPCRKDGFICEQPSGNIFVPYRPQKRLQIVEHAWPRKDDGIASCTKLAPALSPVTDESVWFAYLHASMSYSPKSVLGEWAGFQAAAHEESSLARKSFVALSCSFFGRSNHSNELMQWRNDQYLHCLREVNTRLGDPVLCTSPETLLAVAIFGYHECLLLTVQSAWVKHYSGLARMIEMAGTEACKDRAVFEIFRENRFIMILAAIASKYDSFLSRPEWKSMPWELQNAPKGCMDELLDIVADLPTLRTPEHSKTPDRARSIFGRLDSWRIAWNDLIDSDLKASSAYDPDYPSIWLDPITSSSLLTANCFCIYNGAIIMATDHTLRTSRAEDLQPGDASTLFHQRYEAAIGICRALDYHFQSDIGNLGGLFILWPLRMAAKVLKNGTTQETRWLQERMGSTMQNKVIWNIRQETFQEIYNPGN